MKTFKALSRIGVLARRTILHLLLFLEPELNGGNGGEPTEPEWVTLGTAFTDAESFFLLFFSHYFFFFFLRRGVLQNNFFKFVVTVSYTCDHLNRLLINFFFS
jgi:hypothetical protein